MMGAEAGVLTACAEGELPTDASLFSTTALPGTILAMCAYRLVDVVGAPVVSAAELMPIGLGSKGMDGSCCGANGV